MLKFLNRCAWEAEDWLRYSPLVKGALCRYRLWRDQEPEGADAQGLARNIARLCATARLATSEPALCQIEARILRRTARLDVARVDWLELSPPGADRQIGRAAILKPPIGKREKGVLFVSFEEEWMQLLRLCDLRAFTEQYDLVISPTWSPPHCLGTTVFAHAYPGPLFSLISNARDLDILPRLAPNYVAVPLYASSWVNPGYYHPRPRGERDIDIVMLANFGKYKRHLALFRALRRMAPNLKVLLLGQDQGARTAGALRREAACYGVKQELTIRTNVANEEVAGGLARARISLILSRREGSCVAVVESMFADTPVGLLEGAEVGSRAFINADTGRFLDERNLAAELTAFLAEAHRYEPRRWAEEKLSCFESSRVLNEVLRQHLTAAGQEWTCDLAPMCWRPNPRVVRADDFERLRGARADFEARFGVRIGPEALDYEGETL